MRSASDRAMARVRRALESMDLRYEMHDGVAVLRVDGNDLPIGMMVYSDEENRSLNIYTVMMVDIPEDAKTRLILELNLLNNTVNNGSFSMDPDRGKIFFKIVQSIHGGIPSVETVVHLIRLAFKTMDMNDGNLMGLIPREAVRTVDLMYGRSADPYRRHPPVVAAVRLDLREPCLQDHALQIVQGVDGEPFDRAGPSDTGVVRLVRYHEHPAVSQDPAHLAEAPDGVRPVVHGLLGSDEVEGPVRERKGAGAGQDNLAPALSDRSAVRPPGLRHADGRDVRPADPSPRTGLQHAADVHAAAAADVQAVRPILQRQMGEGPSCALLVVPVHASDEQVSPQALRLRGVLDVRHEQGHAPHR